MIFYFNFISFVFMKRKLSLPMNDVVYILFVCFHFIFRDNIFCPVYLSVIDEFISSISTRVVNSPQKNF